MLHDHTNEIHRKELLRVEAHNETVASTTPHDLDSSVAKNVNLMNHFAASKVPNNPLAWAGAAAAWYFVFILYILDVFGYI